MDTAGRAGARYSIGAIAFHWIIAILIGFNFAAAWIAEGSARAEKMQIMGNHQAIGLLILGLSVLRVVWRLMHRPPPLAETLKAWEAALAKVVHTLFYFLMIALPLAGWLTVSAASGGATVRFFGLFDIPGLPLARDRVIAGTFAEVHEAFAMLMLALIALHVAAALKHQFLDRDDTMARVLPWRGQK